MKEEIRLIQDLQELKVVEFAKSIDLDEAAHNKLAHSDLHCFSLYRISSVIKWSFFPIQNNPKDLDPAYKMDLDLWDCLGWVKLVL